jgi:DNA-binding transcriptional LysR family regulator
MARAGDTREVSVTPVLSVNDLDILRDAVMRGRGVTMLPQYHCIVGLRAKRLERVLPDWSVLAVANS